MQTLRIDTTDGIATITFDEPGSPVNTMCAAWQADIAAAVEQLAAQKDQLKGVILASAKKTFFAGADLKSVMRLTGADAPALFAGIERLKHVLLGHHVEPSRLPILATRKREDRPFRPHFDG